MYVYCVVVVVNTIQLIPPTNILIHTQLVVLQCHICLHDITQKKSCLRNIWYIQCYIHRINAWFLIHYTQICGAVAATAAALPIRLSLKCHFKNDQTLAYNWMAAFIHTSIVRTVCDTLSNKVTSNYFVCHIF